MKKIIIPVIPEFEDEHDIGSISGVMDSQEKHVIENQPWAKYHTDNKTSFSIAHTHQNLLVKYYVKEKQLNAAVRKINGDVHKDNCVELFIAFNNNAEYYNLEFNCLGSAKIGYGKQKVGRAMLLEETIKKIQIHTSLNFITEAVDYNLTWEIFFLIPKDVFQFTPMDTFKGLNAKANFYKCGDDLKEPHFFTWNMVKSASPDFHQPEFFGELYFK